jgi:DNA modification methylase
MTAFALRADGWYLRQDIIWSKPNPMPESVTDRCTKAHEYLFLLAKSERYYFDQEAIVEPLSQASIERLGQNVPKQRGSERVPGKTNGPMKAVGRATDTYTAHAYPHPQSAPRGPANNFGIFEKRNKRSVWTVTTQPFSEAHFATFPPALIEPCILAGCPEGGTVLDPFGGAGTTGMVADRLKRNAILIELNPEYADMAERRIHADAGMFAETQTK